MVHGPLRAHEHAKPSSQPLSVELPKVAQATRPPLTVQKVDVARPFPHAQFIEVTQPPLVTPVSPILG